MLKRQVSSYIKLFTSP